LFVVYGPIASRMSSHVKFAEEFDQDGIDKALLRPKDKTQVGMRKRNLRAYFR
jgi:hypothetical protein